MRNQVYVSFGPPCSSQQVVLVSGEYLSTQSEARQSDREMKSSFRTALFATHSSVLRRSTEKTELYSFEIPNRSIEQSAGLPNH